VSSVIQLAAVGFVTGYLVLVGALLWGWIKAQETPVVSDSMKTPAPLISVVIAARNESGTLPLLIHDLREQLDCSFEVIVVDDHSEDDTWLHCTQAIKNDSRFRLMRSDGVGKKSAISSGIRQAAGSIVVTTDADCRVDPTWLKTLTQRFDDPSTMMVFGTVSIAGSTLFERMQSIEFSTLIGTGAATSAWNAPTMCNGANLAYRKRVFEAVKGYAGNLQIPSGDDEFLMRKVNDAFPDSIKFCGERNALVTTQPSPNVRTFFEQRIRWAGKWRLSKNPTSTLLALSIFLFHCLVVAIPWLVVTGNITVEVAVVALASKAVAEFVYIKSLQRAIGFRWSWTAFLLLQVVYSYYVIIVAGFAQFAGIEWKGRRLRHSMANGH
jgi:cellulose synthase/poly-beta-1,6-N-acetylglucosamine synthase-like glycosyltransferase